MTQRRPLRKAALGVMDRLVLSDTAWEHLAPLLIGRPDQRGSTGQKRGSAEQAIDRSRGGLSTKTHMAVRGVGCPVRFVLTAGQRGDAPQANALL